MASITGTPSTEFVNPEPVTIQGYNGPEQDPTLSPDGSILFFDSHNDARRPTYLYWTKKIDYKMFTLGGEIKGVNHPGAQTFGGTMDRDNNLYFATTFYNGLLTFTRGKFKDGAVTDIEPVKGFPSAPGPPWSPEQTIDFIAGGITPGGTTLLVSNFRMKIGSNGWPGGPVPLAKAVSLTTKNRDGSFSETGNSDYLLKNINELGKVKVLYGIVQSENGLELFFTASDVPSSCGADCRIRIYVARRSSTSEPFGRPQEIPTPWRTPEAPYPSPDGAHLYFHKIISNHESQIYAFTRQPSLKQQR